MNDFHSCFVAFFSFYFHASRCVSLSNFNDIALDTGRDVSHDSVTINSIAVLGYRH
jgi:hypothetical protein